MFGKIKTFMRRHPAITTYLFLCVIFAVMRLFGLPKIYLDLDVFLVLTEIGLAATFGVTIGYKYKDNINKFIDKHFGEALSKIGIVIEINDLKSLFGDIEFKRFVSMVKRNGKFNLKEWRWQACTRITNDLCKVGGDQMEMSSNYLAAIITYSMTDGTDRAQNMEVICDCIMDLLLNPRTYTVIETYSDDDFSIDIDIKKTVWGKKVKLTDRNLILLRQEIISEMMNYAVIPMSEHRMRIMADRFQEAVNYREALKS